MQKIERNIRGLGGTNNIKFSCRVFFAFSKLNIFIGLTQEGDKKNIFIYLKSYGFYLLKCDTTTK